LDVLEGKEYHYVTPERGKNKNPLSYWMCLTAAKIYTGRSGMSML